MAIFGKLFKKTPSTGSDVREILDKLDAQHRELGVELMALVRMPEFDMTELPSYARGVATLLKIQSTAAGSTPIVQRNGNANLKAVGYIYGVADAALQIIGQDMSDESIGVPFACEVYEGFSPAHVETCMQLILQKAGKDAAMTEGMMAGGKEFLAFANSGGNGRMPLTLSKFLLNWA